MYCPSCGKPMDHVQMRCPACGHRSPAFWLNAYSAATWLLIVAVDYLYLAYVLPFWRVLLLTMGMELPFPIRIQTDVAAFLKAYGWLVFLLLVLIVGILYWKKILPGFLKSGKLLASVTWLVVVGTMGGMLATLTYSGILIPSRTDVSLLRESRNELSALDSIREIRSAESGYAEKNPRSGYTCNLEELKAYAAPLFQDKRHPDLLFTGQRDGYSFSLTGCSSKPANYQVTAMPNAPGGTGRFVFCSDESGAVYYSDGSSARECWKKRTPVY